MGTNKKVRSVFINCPLDARYANIRRAIIFTIMDCGFTPRIAIESSDGGQVRITKILDIMADCRLGIHDLSRVGLDRKNHLPRFNMPFELGLFLGAVHFGGQRHRQKRSLIFERRRYELQKCLSDIAGQDLQVHGDILSDVILKVRNWLSEQSASQRVFSGAGIMARFVEFRQFLERESSRTGTKISDMPFTEYCHFIQTWLIGKQEIKKLLNLRVTN